MGGTTSTYLGSIQLPSGAVLHVNEAGGLVPAPARTASTKSIRRGILHLLERLKNSQASVLISGTRSIGYVVSGHSLSLHRSFHATQLWQASEQLLLQRHTTRLPETKEPYLAYTYSFYTICGNESKEAVRCGR